MKITEQEIIESIKYDISNIKHTKDKQLKLKFAKGLRNDTNLLIKLLNGWELNA